MNIALDRKTFVRMVDDDILFYNPITGASMVVENGSILASVITKDFQPCQNVIKKIAENYNALYGQVETDYLPLIEDLVSGGLVAVARDANDCRVKESITAPTVFRQKSGDGKNPVSLFYRQKNLLLALHIDITSNCNERCVHCYLPGYAKNFLPYDNVCKVLKEFRAMHGLTVYISGGECMTHPKFKQILELCRDLDLNIIILSNLTLCDDNMVVFLKEVQPQYVNVSLYSMVAAEHDKITRISGSWQKTMDAILACEKAGVNIRIAAPLLKFNRHAFPMLKRFTEEHNMYLVPDFNIIARANHDDGNLKYACSAEELEEVLQENKDIFDMGWSCVCRDDPEATLCDIGMYRLHLNSEGDFYPCPSMYGYVLGNLNEKSLNAIWKCERLEYLRNLKWKNLSHCMICEHRNFCEPCIAYNFNATGDMFKTIPQKCQAAEVIHRIYGE